MTDETKVLQDQMQHHINLMWDAYDDPEPPEGVRTIKVVTNADLLRWFRRSAEHARTAWSEMCDMSEDVDRLTRERDEAREALARVEALADKHARRTVGWPDRYEARRQIQAAIRGESR